MPEAHGNAVVSAPGQETLPGKTTTQISRHLISVFRRPAELEKDPNTPIVAAVVRLVDQLVEHQVKAVVIGELAVIGLGSGEIAAVVPETKAVVALISAVLSKPRSPCWLENREISSLAVKGGVETKAVDLWPAVIESHTQGQPLYRLDESGPPQCRGREGGHGYGGDQGKGWEDKVEAKLVYRKYIVNVLLAQPKLHHLIQKCLDDSVLVDLGVVLGVYVADGQADTTGTQGESPAVPVLGIQEEFASGPEPHFLRIQGKVQVNHAPVLRAPAVGKVKAAENFPRVAQVEANAPRLQA